MNKVVHFEVTADDPERAKKFYSDVFGWDIKEVPDMSYWMVTTAECDEKTMIPKEPGAINGGMYKRGEEGSKSLVIVINVESIDDHIKKVEEAGGKVVFSKRQVGDMGFYAQVTDTEDNIIGIWQTIKK